MITRRRKGFRKKSIAWILTLTMAFTGMGVNFAFATDGGDDSEVPVTVDKTAQWVDPDEGIAEVSLTVNSGELEITSSATSRIVLVLDCSNSMSSNGKFSNMKTTAKDFVDQMLPPGNTADTQIALVGYNDRADQNHGFSGNATGIKNNITNLVQGSGTHIQDGIKKGQEYLDGVTADNEFIVVLSDGEPTYSFKATKAIADSDDVLTNYSSILTEFSTVVVPNSPSYSFPNYLRYSVDGYEVRDCGHATVSQAYLAKQKGTTIYSIGFDIAGSSNAQVTMQDVASAGKYYSASSGDLDDVFANISQSITEIIEASGATVTDPVGFSTDTVNDLQYKFEGIITDNVNYPIATTVPSGAAAGSYSYDESTDQFTWHLTTGNVKAGEYTFTYYVDLDVDGAGTELENVLTNDGAQLAYTDGDGVPKSIDFPDPELPITHYTVEYYYSENGGSTYTKDDSLTDKLNAIVGCTDKTDAGLKAAGEKAGYDYIKTKYGDSDTATDLVIDTDQSKNTIKIYYSKYYAQGSVPLAAIKDYNKTLSGGEFSFKAQAADEDGNIITGDGSFSTSVTNLALGIVGFSIGYDQDDIGNTYYYLISEDSTEGTLANKTYIDYSDEAYLAKVKVKDTDHDGTLDFEVTYYAKDDSDQYTVELTGDNVPAFTNEYEAEKTINLIAEKVLENKTLSAGDFTFDAVQAEEVAGEWVPISGGWSDSDVSNAADGSISFKDIDYTEEDAGKTFFYMITEDAGSDSKMQYDQDPLIIKVEVSDNNDGTLTALETVVEGDTDKEFVNTFTPDSVKAALKATKNITGREFKTGDDFIFELYKGTDTSGSPWKTVDTTAQTGTGETVQFGDISYGLADMDGQTSKDFTYTIKERVPAEATDNKYKGVTYDTKEVTVTVTVEYDKDEGLLSVDKIKYGDSDTAQSAEFTNEYEADPVNVKLEADKELTGKQLESDQFEFKATETDENGDPISGGKVLTAKNDVTGSIEFDNIQFDETGTFYYEITEENGGSAIGGISYDDLAVLVKIEIIDNGEGSLEAATAYPRDTTFNNSFEGKITVNKDFFVDGEKLTNETGFSVGLFKYAPTRPPEQGMTMIKIDEDVVTPTTPAVFDGLGAGEYFVYELDKDGNPLKDAGDITGKLIFEGVRTMVLGYTDNEEIEIDEGSSEESVTVTNTFRTEQDFYFGGISVTKNVLVNGQEKNMDKTFYAALFTDRELTERATDKDGKLIPLLALKGGETKEFGGGLDIEKTYYVAETDENGNIITDPMTQLGMEGIKSAQIEYSGCEAIVLEPEKDYMGSALIINKFTTSGDEYYYDKPIIHTVKVSATSESSKTGDDSNMALWILLALLGTAGIVTPLAVRRKNAHK